MVKTAYIECFSGASGDMFLGSLLGLLKDNDKFLAEIAKLSIKDEFELKIGTSIKKGITATDVDVILKKHEHHHRGLKDIEQIIEASDISEKAKGLALKIFTTLAIAEAKVHGTTVDHVHFHEVGAIDALVDITGFAILFDMLSIEKVVISPVNTGSGFVKAAHGVLPVPAPATIEIIKNSAMPVCTFPEIECEALTPTGAAILATIRQEYGEYGKMPNFKQIESISYGSGKKDFEKIANVLRISVGDTECESLTAEKVIVLEANIDDMSPEHYEFAMEELYTAGALEVYLTPVIMKKSRPATLLTVLCNQDSKAAVENAVFKHTTTIGVRWTEAQRTVLQREVQTVNIPEFGEIKVKVSKDSSGNIINMKPEYDDIVALARTKRLSLSEIYSKIKFD